LSSGLITIPFSRRSRRALLFIESLRFNQIIW
jgi:hypothetical protein